MEAKRNGARADLMPPEDATLTFYEQPSISDRFAIMNAGRTEFLRSTANEMKNVVCLTLLFSFAACDLIRSIPVVSGAVRDLTS
jgi:hypothetical protein